MGWLFSPESSPLVGGIGLVLSVVGFLLTVFGLFMTYQQVVKAKDAATSAKHAVDAFRFRARQHNAARDISEALYAVETTKRHLATDSWRDASDAYEDARRALIRLEADSHDLLKSIYSELNNVQEHMSAFCTEVDEAIVGKGRLPDKVKVLGAIRHNYRTLVLARTQIEREASNEYSSR